MPMVSEDEDELLEMLQEDKFSEQDEGDEVAALHYLECLESCPNMEIDPGKRHS